MKRSEIFDAIMHPDTVKYPCRLNNDGYCAIHYSSPEVIYQCLYETPDGLFIREEVSTDNPITLYEIVSESDVCDYFYDNGYTQTGKEKIERYDSFDVWAKSMEHRHKVFVNLLESIVADVRAIKESLQGIKPVNASRVNGEKLMALVNGLNLQNERAERIIAEIEQSRKSEKETQFINS